MGFGVCDMFVDLFCGEEVEFFELLDGFVFLHKIIIYLYESLSYFLAMIDFR